MADTWSRTFDFTESDWGWTCGQNPLCTNPDGIYIPGVGFETNTIFYPAATYRVVTANYRFSPATIITRIEVHFAITTLDTQAGHTGDIDGIIGSLNGASQFSQLTYYENPPSSPMVWTGNATVDLIQTGITAGVNTAGDTSGLAHITRIALEGLGANPFLPNDSHECPSSYVGTDAEELEGWIYR